MLDAGSFIPGRNVATGRAGGRRWQSQRGRGRRSDGATWRYGGPTGDAVAARWGMLWTAAGARHGHVVRRVCNGADVRWAKTGQIMVQNEKECCKSVVSDQSHVIIL